jgi:hypothetical protein
MDGWMDGWVGFSLSNAQRRSCSGMTRQVPTPQSPDRGSFTEISFGLTYRDSRRPVAAGEQLAPAGGR